MSALRMLKSSGTTSLDRAAQNALTRQPLDAPARRLRPAARDDAGHLLLQRGAARLLTRKRVVNHASAAWVAAVAGAWIVAAACRTMQGGVASAPAGVSTTAPGPLASVPAPSIRVGLVTGAARASIGADSGVVVHGRAAGETAVRVRALPRATFHSSAAGRLLLLETGDELELGDRGPRRSGGAAAVGRDALPGPPRSPPRRRGPSHGRERRPPRGLPPGRRPERAVAPGLPADRGVEGAGGRGADLRPLSPRRLFLEGLRRLRDALLPGLPGAVLGAPAHRPRGRGDEGNRRHVAGPGDPRVLHVDLRWAHRRGRSHLRRRRPVPARGRLPPGALVAPHGADDLAPAAGSSGRAGDRPRRCPAGGPRGDRRHRRPRPPGSTESPPTPRCGPGPAGSRWPCTAADATARSAAHWPAAPPLPGTWWPPPAGASGRSACSRRATRSTCCRPRTPASSTGGSARPWPCWSTRGWFRRRRTTRSAPTPR